MSPHFALDTIDGHTVVRLAGPKLPLDASPPLYGLVEREGHRRLLLDFGNVRFLSSSGLAIVVGLKKRVDAVGGRLALCRLEPDLLELFRLTSLDSIVEIFDSEQDALQGSRAQPPG